MERTNARTLTAATLPEPVDVVTIDVSFISLARVLGPIAIDAAAAAAHVVALVKPQFEAGRGRTDHGVVRDPAIHREVLERVVGDAAAAGLGHARGRSPRRSSGRRATASSSSTSPPGPAAPRSATASPRSTG